MTSPPQFHRAKRPLVITARGRFIPILKRVLTRFLGSVESQTAKDCLFMPSLGMVTAIPQYQGR